MREMLKNLRDRVSRKRVAAADSASTEVIQGAVTASAEMPPVEPHLDAELSDVEAVRGAGERVYAAEPLAAEPAEELSAVSQAPGPHAEGEPSPASTVLSRADAPNGDAEVAADAASEAAPRLHQALDELPAATSDTPSTEQGSALDEAVPARRSAVARLRESASARMSSVRERLSRGRAGRKASRPKYSAIPIRVIMGYLPEVSERDAREYALGMAEKHFEQIGMAYFAVFEHERGFVYEVHEGGDGLAYAPEILKYFEAQGPFRIGEHVSVHVRTATRMVEIERLREGLAALVLPESSDAQQTEWLEGTEKMEQALNRRTGLLLAGAGLFVTGFTAMLVAAFLARYQPYEEAPPVQTEYINAQDLPLSQWSRLESVQAPNFVRALRYRAGKWEAPEVSTDAAAVPPSAPGAAPGAAPTPGAPAPAAQ